LRGTELYEGARSLWRGLRSRRRLDLILERPDTEKLRRTRMVEVLERIGTWSARRFLQELAAQTEDGALAALTRIVPVSALPCAPLHFSWT
jgi:hypothetical protein